MLGPMSELIVRRPGVVVPVGVDPSGEAGPTPRQARGRRWRRTGRNLFVPAEVSAARAEQRIVEVAAGLPDGAAITGWAGLAWLGARWFDGLGADGMTPLPVPVAVDDRRRLRPRAGVALSEDWLFAGDVIEVDGLQLTAPARSVTWEARRARSVVAAVQVIDMAAYDDLVELDDLRAYADRLVARQGVRQLRLAVEHADENAWSPQEPPMRMAWTEDAHLPRPLCNVPVFDRSGRHLFTPDLFDPRTGVAGEYNGGIHREHELQRSDLNRDASYREHGIEAVTMMSGDRWDTADFVARLRAAYRRAAARPDADTWTLEQPDWWVDTSTVARRRSLTDAERQRWLDWRRPGRRT
jgi:hypothetical protein